MALNPEPHFDPHGLKDQGANSAKHAFVNDPYVHQEFPKVLYKTVDGKQVSATVLNEDGLDKAKAEGFGVSAEPTPAVAPGPAVFSHTVYSDASGNVVAVGKKEAITTVEVPTIAPIVFEGSGSERWRDSDWTQGGDGKTYPVVVPTQAEADAAAQPDPIEHIE
jgi:hypothetical protein